MFFTFPPEDVPIGFGGFDGRSGKGSLSLTYGSVTYLILLLSSTCCVCFLHCRHLSTFAFCCQKKRKIKNILGRNNRFAIS